jgi:hypothetical protein
MANFYSADPLCKRQLSGYTNIQIATLFPLRKKTVPHPTSHNNPLHLRMSWAVTDSDMITFEQCKEVINGIWMFLLPIQHAIVFIFDYAVLLLFSFFPM